MLVLVKKSVSSCEFTQDAWGKWRLCAFLILDVVTVQVAFITSILSHCTKPGP